MNGSSYGAVPMSAETRLRYECRVIMRAGKLVRCRRRLTHHATRLEGGRRDVAVRLWLLCILQLAAGV